ncbi:MAG: hypothetical protein OXG27_13840 [Chloroflexi bacterium]|nr:hypothetical protein [Chloroflexota bacterium]
MTGISPLLGHPEDLARLDPAVALDALTSIWVETMGTEPADLEEDLALARRWFDPVAQGQRLRRELLALNATTADGVPGPPWTLEVAPASYLVTPEGRCLIDYLSSRYSDRSEGGTARIIDEYDRLLGSLYRAWSRHRIESVVGLLAGTDKPLQIPAAGVVIALLANRCTDERRALTRFAGGPNKHLVDSAFFAPVQRFADVLSPSGRRDRTNQTLVSGWMLYEARRRLGGGLEVRDARGGKDGKVWVRADAVADVIRRVAQDLSRGHRAHATPELFAVAFDALVEELRVQLPSLAAFGLIHERPRDTARLRAQFLEHLTELQLTDDESGDGAS